MDAESLEVMLNPFQYFKHFKHFKYFNHSQQGIPDPKRGTFYRQGDVLLQRVDHLPPDRQQREGGILAHGEATGHRHRIQQVEKIQLWIWRQDLFLEVKNNSATLVHEEHDSIELPCGLYLVTRQREYRPESYVDVID